MLENKRLCVILHWEAGMLAFLYPCQIAFIGSLYMRQTGVLLSHNSQAEFLCEVWFL